MRGRPDRFLVVVVDDGSTDGTVLQAEAAVTETHGALPLQVLRHDTNRGLGAGIRTGIYWVLDRADPGIGVPVLSDDDIERLKQRIGEAPGSQVLLVADASGVHVYSYR